VYIQITRQAMHRIIPTTYVLAVSARAKDFALLAESMNILGEDRVSIFRKIGRALETHF
jgi:hypothetical protein